MTFDIERLYYIDFLNIYCLIVDGLWLIFIDIDTKYGFSDV